MNFKHEIEVPTNFAQKLFVNSICKVFCAKDTRSSSNWRKFSAFLVNFSLLPTDVIFEKNQLFFALLSSTQCENSRILLPLLPFNIFPHNIHWAHLIPEKLQVVIKSQGQKNYLIFALWKRNHFGDNTFSSHSKPFSFSKNSRNTPRLQD